MARGTVVPLLGWSPGGDAHRARGMPLGELFETVLRLVWSAPTFRDKTRRNARRSRELARALPDHPSPADVLAWCSSMRATFGEATVYLHWKTLRAVYRYGADLGLTTGNPAALVPVRKPSSTPAPIVNIAELWPSILAAGEDPRERAFLGVLRFAGLRRGEALGLTADDVNTYATPWRLEVVRQRPNPNDLRATLPKTPASARELAVREPLRLLLADVLALGPAYVWTGKGGQRPERVPWLFPFREAQLAALGERVRERAPLAFPAGDLWHSLRDTLAAELRHAGKTTGQVSEALGHTSEYVTRTHYLGAFGRTVPAAVFDGLDPPPDAGGAPTVAAAGAPRRSKAVPPTVKQEEKRCHTPSQKRSHQQRRKPAAAVEAAATAGTTTATTAAPSAGTSRAPARSTSGRGTGRQRALPGLSAVAATTRPGRAAPRTPARAPRRPRQ